ncbi:MAG: hypothetical protein AAGA93_03125 [Actinomycetota bacterium]
MGRWRRRPSRRLAALAVVAIGMAVAGPGTAAVDAQGNDTPQPREYGESGVRSGVVRVEAGANWLPVGSEGSGGGGSSCTTSSARIVVDDDFVQPVNRGWTDFGTDGSLPFLAEPTDLPASLPTALRWFSPTGRWYEVMCDGAIDIVAEGGPPVTIAGLMQRAIDEIDPPDPELAVVPTELHVTQLPSWLAVEPAYWFTRESNPVTAGRVWVIGYADPYQVIWDPGDGTGELAPCDEGVVWRAGLEDEANSCPYIYRRSSAGAPGNAFTMTATVSFEVTAASNAPGADGAFPDIERTTSVDVQVGEIQAVND